MSAAVEEPRLCIVCGGPLPVGAHASRRLCSSRCASERQRATAHAWWAAHGTEANAARPDHGGRAGTLRGFALDQVVLRDRRAFGQLAHVVEWPADTCPRRRGDLGPCIHVGCRRHLCSEVDDSGGLWIDPRFEADPYSVATCSLDVAIEHRDGQTLEEVGQVFDLTRERIRQIEARALGRCEHPSRAATLKEMLELSQDSERPSTPLGRVQGVGPSLGGGGEVWRNQVPRPEPSLCRRPETPHAAPPPATRRVYGLPPSLQGHEAEFRTGRRGRRSRPPWPAVAIGDQQSPAVSIPEVSPPETAEGDTEGTHLNHETVDALVDLGTAKPAARGDDDRSVAHVAWTVELDVEFAEQVRAVAKALGMRPRRVLPLLARYGLEALDQVERPRRPERSEKR